jgi:cytochrome c7-like protein/class III cytochrome C family protein
MSLKTATILSLLVTVIGAAVFLQGASFRWFGNQQGYAPVQPIQFSHKVHAGDNQISCLYCHSSAEKSKVAGIPAVAVCMNCHSQIRKDSPEVQKIAQSLAEVKPIAWVKVHSLPKHAVFNHSRHVSAGFQCQQCHGEVEKMERVTQATTLLMGMCVGCHRTHRSVTMDAAGRPVISEELAQARLQASTDCAVCHH